MKKVKKMDFLSLENMESINGGYDVEFCVYIEVKECVKAEGKYCGTKHKSSDNTHEFVGPVNPWGEPEDKK